MAEKMRQIELEEDSVLVKKEKEQMAKGAEKSHNDLPEKVA